MNTYEARHITEVPPAFQAEARQVALEAIEAQQFISVQLQDFYYDDVLVFDLYGIYMKSETEVNEYYSSGGLWYYYNPVDFLA